MKKHRNRVLVNLSLNDQEKAKLVEVAKKESRSLCNLIRIALNRFLEQYEKENAA